MTDAVTDVSAESRATKVSYVPAKHEWTVTNDVFSCNKGQPYTTLFKLSGCNPVSEFTCNDGQCVSLEVAPLLHADTLAIVAGSKLQRSVG